MDIALFSADGILFAFRWLHIFFGVIWIGHLYYFNFVQGAFFAETDASTKTNAIQKLVPRALWWFRWGAMWTLITGLIIITGRLHQGLSLTSSWGVMITSGMVLGLFMWLNVWFIIWPNQKIVIENASGKPNPNAASAGAKAALASRTNTLFSIPMLFFMAAARNLTVTTTEESCYGTYAIIFSVIVLALEANAIKGKMGPMTTIKGVITSGFILAAALYVLVEVLI